MQRPEHRQRGYVCYHIVRQIHELQVAALFNALERLNEVMAHVKYEELLSLDWMQHVNPAEHVFA